MKSYPMSMNPKLYLHIRNKHDMVNKFKLVLFYIQLTPLLLEYLVELRDRPEHHQTQQHSSVRKTVET